MEPTRLQFLGLAMDLLRASYYKHMLIIVEKKTVGVERKWGDAGIVKKERQGFPCLSFVNLN
jgi:hypothetical protein